MELVPVVLVVTGILAFATYWLPPCYPHAAGIRVASAVCVLVAVLLSTTVDLFPVFCWRLFTIAAVALTSAVLWTIISACFIFPIVRACNAPEDQQNEAVAQTFPLQGYWILAAWLYLRWVLHRSREARALAFKHTLLPATNYLSYNNPPDCWPQAVYWSAWLILLAAVLVPLVSWLNALVERYCHRQNHQGVSSAAQVPLTAV